LPTIQLVTITILRDVRLHTSQQEKQINANSNNDNSSMDAQDIDQESDLSSTVNQ
jgi:hypothetical protein